MRLSESKKTIGLSEKQQIVLVQRNKFAIVSINNPSEAVQLAAVKQDGYMIRHIKNPSKDVIITSILKIIHDVDSFYIIDQLLKKYEHNKWPELDVIKNSLRADKKLLESTNINDMTEEEQIKFIKRNPFSIDSINNPSLKVQLAAVQQNGYVIKYISNPSLAIQIASIKEYVMSIEYIDNPSPKLFIECKNIIIKFILEVIKENHTVSIISIIEYLDKHNVKWPELEIIKQSLKHDRII